MVRAPPECGAGSRPRAARQGCHPGEGTSRALEPLTPPRAQRVPGRRSAGQTTRIGANPNFCRAFYGPGIARPPRRPVFSAARFFGGRVRPLGWPLALPVLRPGGGFFWSGGLGGGPWLPGWGRPRSAGEQLRLMADASEWLAGHGVGPSDLTEVRVAELMVARRAAGRFHLLSVCAIAPLLEYLRGVGVVPVAVAASPVTPSEALIERYSAYLLQRRGLSSSTVRNYAGVARVFLSWREVTMGTLALGELDGAAVIAFVLGESRRGSVGSAKCLVTRLRAFLRFLHVEGDTCRELAGVVPSVASWRLAGLVKALDAGAVARLVASCDRRTRVGRRDFAVITLLSRLGLRAGEVAALRLADIDWRLASCWFVARAAGRSVCRCPAMSARRSLAGCPADARGASACSCSPGSALPWLALVWLGRQRSCSMRAVGQDYRWSALTGSGTRPRPRCSRAAEASQRSARCCVTEAGTSPRSTP